MISARTLGAALLLAGALASAAPVWAQNDLAEVQVQMAEARRHFEALEYEQAVPALDRAIAIMATRRTEDTRNQLAEAYELRARARFGLGDQNGARDDFISLLKVSPGRTLSGQISPRVVAIFEDAQKATVTTLKVAVTPANASVMLDGAPIASTATLPIVLGDHTLTASRQGYRPGTATINATAGPGAEVSMNLERTSAVLSLVTTPVDVDVIVDGVVKGKTAAGPPPSDYTERAARAGVALQALSAVLVVPDLTAGSHTIQFRRGCYVTAERRLDVTQLDDLVLDPVKLDRAVATVVAQANQVGTNVFIDGEEKGSAPQTLELCEGDHLVELRSPNGRYSQKVSARAGQRVQVVGTLKPAFALVSASATGPLNSDLRTAVERAFEPVTSVLVFAPPADKVAEALRPSQLPADWLSFDANRRPLGVTTDINAPLRRELSQRIAKAFDAQGIASVTIPSPSNRNRVVVTLLGAGNAEPDVIEMTLDRADTIADAVAQLNRPLAFSRPSIGLATIDAADVPGAIVAAVDNEGPSRNAAQAGDIVLKVNDQAIADSAALATVLAAHKAGDDLGIDLKAKTGEDKKATVKVAMTPRLIGMNDQTLLANRVLAELKARLLTAANEQEESVIRLNMAAALARLQLWSDAKAELQKVKLPESRAVGNGTVQYLLGLCADNLGSRAEAETAWRVAASSESLLTEDGPPVRELAEARLAELARRPAGR